MENKDILKPCPFCNGSAKVSFRQMYFYGFNELGWRKIKYGCQIICNKCKARGGLITDVYIVKNGIFNVKDGENIKTKAVESWNSRISKEQ